MGGVILAGCAGRLPMPAQSRLWPDSGVEREFVKEEAGIDADVAV